MEKKKEVQGTILPCENCGGNLVFDPRCQELKCFNCGTLKKLKKNKAVKREELNIEAKSKSKHDWGKNVKVFKCENCGGEVCLTNNQISSKCEYCSSGQVFETQKLPGLVPDAVIPFQFDKIQAKQKFAESVKKKFFLPNKFKKNLSPEKIHPTYIPSFRFSSKSHTKYEGSVAQTRTVFRNGKSQTSTVFVRVSGKIDCNFVDLTVEASSKMSTLQINSISPFESKDAYVFEEGFLRGYPAEHYDDNLENCHKTAILAMTEQIKKQICEKHNVSNVDSIEIQTIFDEEKYVYCLLPVYKIDITYNKKKYSPLMNGQTGKVGGPLPKSMVKISFAVGFVVLIVILIVVLDYFL